MTLHPKLSSIAQTGHVMHDLHSSSLLSAGQLCDDNCVVVLNKTSAHVYKNNKQLLQGTRNLSDRLWDIQIPIIALPQHITQQVNAIIRKDTTKNSLTEYLYRSCFSPPLSTLRVAIARDHFLTWPGFQDKNVCKYLAETMATAKGHLDQEMKNLQ